MVTEVYSSESLGERIRRFRKDRGMSQTTLAEKIRVTNGWISQIEQDKATASPDVLNNIALALKVPIRELLQNEEEHMELVSRIKLVEVMLETFQPVEAEPIILDLLDHPQLSEKDHHTITVHLAECKYQQKQTDASLALLHPLIDSLEAANHHDAYLLSWIRNQIGKAYFQKGDFTRSYYNFQKAYEYTARYEADSLLAGRISYNLAVSLRFIGRLNDADFYLEQSHRLCNKLSDLKQLGKNFYEQGLIYKNKRDFSRAAELFEQAKVIFQTLNLQSFLIVVQDTIASEVTVRSDRQLAIQQLRDCMRQLEENREIERMILVLSKIANIHLQGLEYEESFNALQQAQKLIREHDKEQTPDAAQCYRVFAQYYFDRSDFENSKVYASKSVDIFGSIGFVIDQIDSLKLIVDSFQAQGAFEMALHHEKSRSELYTLLLRRGEGQ